ncbi:MAG: hypothetical protein ACXV8T_15450 [Acidimicrobiia bacterium]
MSGSHDARPAARVHRVGAVAALLAAVLVAGCAGSDHHPGTDVIERAASAMHVDPNLARYSLEVSDDGGTLAVTVDDQFESDQVERVRAFLRAQPARLARGDVGGLQALLGDDAPGLTTIAYRHADLHVAYVDDATGGRLVLRSTRHEVVAAVHQMLNQILVHFGDVATVPATGPDTSTTTTGPRIPSGLLG